MKIPCILYFAVALYSASGLQATTRTWDGGGGTANFSTPANWNPDGAPANGDDLVFPSTSPATVNNDLASRTFGTLTIQRSLTLSGNAFTLTNGLTSSPPVLGGPVTIAANVTLGASQTFTSGGGTLSTLTFSGSVAFGAHTLTAAGARSFIFAGITGSSTAGSRLLKTGTGLLRMDTAALLVTNQPFTLTTGTLDVDGICQVPVTMTGGVLTGSGTLGLGLDASAGEIVPDAADLAISGNVLLRGTVNLRTSLTGPSDESALDCSGGTVALQDQATLEVLSTAYTPVRGDTFQLLTKSTASAITGTFSNTPAGTEFTAGTSILRASYTGGNGNDLVLSTVSTTHTWDAGHAINRNWDEPANWAGDVLPQSGDILVFPPGFPDTQMDTDNNFPADTAFRQLVLTGEFARIRGARLRLTHGIIVGGSLFRMDTDIVLAADLDIEFQGGAANEDRVLRFDQLDKLDTNGRTVRLRGTGTLAGRIEGTGGVRAMTGCHVALHNVTGFAPLVFSSYAGSTVVETGATLSLDARSCLGAETGGTLVGGLLRIVDSANVPGTVFTLDEPLALLPDSIVRCESALSGGTAAVRMEGPLDVRGPGTSRIEGLGRVHVLVESTAFGAGNLILAGSSQSLMDLSLDAAGTFTNTISLSGEGNLVKPVNCSILQVRRLSGSTTAVFHCYGDNKIPDTCQVFVGDEGLLDFNGDGVTGAGDQADTFKSLHLSNGGAVEGTNNTLITLTGDLSVSQPNPACRVNVALRFTGAPANFDVSNGADAVDLQVQRAITGAPGAHLRRTGAGRAVLDAACSVPVELVEGATVFNGSSPGTAITLNGGTLAGTGTVGNVHSLAGGGRVEAGTGQGIMSTGSLSWNAATTYAAAVLNATPGTGHTRIAVTGTVSLGNAALTVTAGGAGLTLPAGGVAALLLNDGAEPVAGTFAGLPEGAFIPLSAAGAGGFSISYKGGDGNDVTLTRVLATPVEPQVTGFTYSAGAGPNGQDQAAFTGTAGPNAPLKLEASTNLLTWTPVQSFTASPGGILSVTINQPANIPRRYFRVLPQ